MQRDLVETRGWISKKDYVDGLALAQLAPGPLAAQLAIYLGWAKGRVFGGAAVIAIIARSAVKLIKLTLGKDRLLWGLFALSAVATAWTESEIVWLFLGSGVVALIVRTARTRGARLSSLLPPGIVAIVAGVAA